MNPLEHMMAVTDAVLNPMTDAEMKRHSEDLESAREIKFWDGVDEGFQDEEEDNDD